MKINNHKCVYTSNAILRILNQKGGNYGTEVNKSSVLVTPLTLSHRTCQTWYTWTNTIQWSQNRHLCTNNY